MHNKFYKPFDCDLRRKRQKDSRDIRTPFQHDRDRIIHSFPLRRLQAKTQVFWSGEYDFYRTRLTHTIEVSQLGRSICNILKGKEHLLSESFYIDPDLVEAICLAHDLGHPPFGHASEARLNDLMSTYGGFEANAQTLRMITQTFYSSSGGRYGMDPTRAFIDGVMKYKTPYSERGGSENHFIYDYQQRFVDLVFDHRDIPVDISSGDKLNNFRSIECQIMDWADDIAYAISDFSDGIRAGFINREDVEMWVIEKKRKHQITEQEDSILKNIMTLMGKKDKEIELSHKIGELIESCRLKRIETFMSASTNRYCFQLVIGDREKSECELYKRLSYDLVFKSASVCQLEHKSNLMLEQIFIVLKDNYVIKKDSEEVLIPKDIHDAIQSKKETNERARMICDYVAGMTDQFAVRTYKRLFDPDFGSIADFV